MELVDALVHHVMLDFLFKKLVHLLVLLVVALALADPLKHSKPVPVAAPGANPPNPQWPDAYSATTFITRDGGQPTFRRWFYDSTLDMDRFDEMAFIANEGWWQTTIFNHVTEEMYLIFEQPNTALCWYQSINGTVPHPDFSVFSYLGQGNIQFNPAYIWYYNDQSINTTFTYWDNQSSREPLRLDISSNSGRFQETWLFFEFDVATDEDKNLYVIPSQILSTCNQHTN